MVRGPSEKDTCRDYVVPRLEAAGWFPDGEHRFVEQVPISPGKVVRVGNKHRRATPLKADYVLEYQPGVPVAAVEAKRAYKFPAAGMQEAKNYAQLLDVPFAYSTNGHGIVEDDRVTGKETRDLTGFPSPDELWSRYREWKGIVDDAVEDGLLLPFNRDVRNVDGSVKEPRYYQQVAVNRAVQAILQGQKRLLLTLATGTGKTFVSLQIVWKLWRGNWRPDRKPRILYLADRNLLVDQPIAKEYQPAFGGGANSPIWKLRGQAKRGREIYFALYQAIADDGGDPNGIFRDFPADFFDLVIVDECHRGSAREDSAWRSILEYYSSATQLGMTATPKRDETADTYHYFGNPLYHYSLAQGIANGFLAPYRVRRVVLSPDAHGWAPSEGQLDRYRREIPPGLYETRHFERVVSLLDRTEAAARYLTDYLRSTDRWDKTLVFCVDQEHADDMRSALHNANSDITPNTPTYVVRIVSDEKKTGQAHFGQFADTQTDAPVIVTTSLLLSTGVDLPTVKNIVLFRPIGSLSLFKQMIGRGTRLFPDAGKLSFDIIDFVGATALFNDPEFDGPPEKVNHEEVDDAGKVVQAAEVKEPEPPFEQQRAETRSTSDGGGGDGPGPAGPQMLDPADVDEPVRAKFYVDDVEVWVTAEAVYHIDPATGFLRLVEYRDFVVRTTRSLFTDPSSLRSLWATPSGRQQVRDELAARGIDDRELLERLELTDIDPLDVLVHLAWNQPLPTRSDRARRVRREHADFFEKHRPEARAVLTCLLDKYADHGIDELDDLAVLRVPPFPDFGSPSEIAARFGSPENLREAVDEMGSLLYAA